MAHKKIMAMSKHFMAMKNFMGHEISMKSEEMNFTNNEKNP